MKTLLRIICALSAFIGGLMFIGLLFALGSPLTLKALICTAVPFSISLITEKAASLLEGNNIDSSYNDYSSVSNDNNLSNRIYDSEHGFGTRNGSEITFDNGTRVTDYGILGSYNHNEGEMEDGKYYP